MGLVWILLVTLLWYVPGVGFTRWLSGRLEMPPAIGLAMCWAAVPVVFSILAIPLGILDVDPRIPAITAVVAGAALAARRSSWHWWARHVGAVRMLFLVPVLIGAFVGVQGDPLVLESDSLAHIAAIRNAQEEQAVFPVRGFTGDPASRGADPRFGTLHALNALAAELPGGSIQGAWDYSRAAGAILLVAGGLALLTTMAGSAGALTVGLLALLGTTGGSYYNALAVAAYPLWFSLGIIWTLCAVAYQNLFARTWAFGLTGGLILGSLAGVHFFAFMLAGFLVGLLSLAAPRDRRADAMRALLLAVLVAAPFVAMRFAVSYSNVNPIHQRVWQCLEWAPGLYSVSPVYFVKWLFPFGIGVLIWGVVRMRFMGADLRFRWWMLVGLVAILWTSVPWILTPSMKLLGFLPLRLYMAIGTPFLLALLVENQRRRRPWVVAALAIALTPAVLGRGADLLAAPDTGILATDAWDDMLAVLPVGEAQRTVLVSDPYSMMAVRASRDVDVMAVPDGRSSPRDFLAVERLRDAWHIMSPAADGAETERAMRRWRVTHVLVNSTSAGGPSSYEFPALPDDPALRNSKFAFNPERFSEIFRRGDLVLYAVDLESGEPWNDAGVRPCRADGVDGPGALGIGSGYALVDPSVRIVTRAGGTFLHVQGALVWSGEGPAPDLQLVVRMDRTPPRVPDGWWFVGKPWRKVVEALGGRVDRYRWATYPGDGHCPAWRAQEVGPLWVGVDLELGAGTAPGVYRVCVAMADRSIFTPLRVKDFFVDDDSYQGPEIGSVTVP